MTNAQPKTIYLKDYEAPTHTIENTYLTFELFEGHTFVTQKTIYKRDASKRADLKLHHGKDIDLVHVHVNGKNIINYKLNTEFLTIPCPGDDFTLEN